MHLGKCLNKMEQEITIRVGQKPLRGFFWSPAKEPSTPDRALVLIFPNYAGLKQFDRDVGKWVASLGYHALVCDYYSEEEFPYPEREAANFPLESPEREKHFQKGMAVMNSCMLSKARSFLRPMVNEWLRTGIRQLTHEDVAKPDFTAGHAPVKKKIKVSTLGYCLGGVAGLELWRSSGGGQSPIPLDAVVCVHGVLKTVCFDQNQKPEAIDAQKENCYNAKSHLLVEHGESDHLVPEEMVQEFIQEADAKNCSGVTLHRHPDTPHGFALPLGVGNAAYPVADRNSTLNILKFWREQLFQEIPQHRVTKTPGGVDLQ
ncbi:unnamed protein product [Amoebophrya sp. A25]|nr:unnamed protein product [Amoebophrya sp. A25]|eukprot:GSA25T00013944001.1